MGTNERILTIRLMEKLQVFPGYAKALGIKVSISNHGAADKRKEK